jgi:sugar-specific transcriptional regulator TrmB
METFPLLFSLGFTTAEQKIYLAILGMNNTTTGEIIRKTGVARSKVYDLLERLEDKGLVTEIQQGKTRVFCAIDPERILTLIHDRQQQAKKDEEEFKSILPSLRSLQQHRVEEEFARMYIGFEGVESFFDSALRELTPKDEYLAFTFVDKNLRPALENTLRIFHRERSRKGIPARILCQATEKEVLQKINFSSSRAYELRSTTLQLPTGIAMFRHTVATMSWTKTPRVFSITCKENTDQYRLFFEDIWARAKKEQT